MLCSTNTSLVPHLAQGSIAQWDSLVSPSPHRPSKDSGSSQASPHFLFAFPLREAQALSPAQSWALQAQQRWQHKSLCYGQLCPCQPRDDKMKGFYTCEILMDAQKNNYKLTVCGKKKLLWITIQDVQNPSYWFRILKALCLIPCAIM